MMMILVALIGRSVIAQDAASVGEAATTRSWTLYQRLWVTGGDSSAEMQPWQVRGTVHLTAAVIELRDPAPVPASLIRDIQTLDGRAGGGKTWYQLQLVEGTDATSTEPTVLTSVPACQVVRAKFRDELVVHLHPLTAHALSLTYMPLLSPWAPNSCADVEVNTTAPWETKISWDTAVPGMRVGLPPLVDPITKVAVAGGSGAVKAPPGILWSPGAIPKKTGDPAAAAANNEKADPFAFFKRYWYILVPMLLMNLVAGGSQAPAAADAPPASGGATAAVGAAGAATAAAGSAVRQRRGKKD